jgi:hypothetical protein
MNKFTKLQQMIAEAMEDDILPDDPQVIAVIDVMAEWFELVLEDMGLEPASIPALLRWQYLHVN